MENIIKFKDLIEEALEKYSGFEPYFSQPINVWTDSSKMLKSSDDLKSDADGYLNIFQLEFIEARRKEDNSLMFLKNQLKRIELLFSRSTYSVEFPIRHKKNNLEWVEMEKFYYDFSAIEKDLPQGRIKGESEHGVISHLLATANFYLWLKELEAETFDSSTGQRTLEPKQKILILEYLGIIDKLRGDGFENKEIAQILGALVEMQPAYLQTELSTPKEKRANKKNLERIIEVFGNIHKIRQNAENQLNKLNKTN